MKEERKHDRSYAECWTIREEYCSYKRYYQLTKSKHRVILNAQLTKGVYGEDIMHVVVAWDGELDSPEEVDKIYD